MRTGQCASCKADILWVKTAKDRPIPLDALPVANGNIYLDEQERAIYRTKDTDPTIATWYQSHFVTCPDADRFRKRP